MPIQLIQVEQIAIVNNCNKIVAFHVDKPENTLFQSKTYFALNFSYAI